MNEQIPQQVIIDGGYKHTVKDAAGNPVEVFIRLVPVSKASEYVSHSLDLAKFVDFLCGKRDSKGQYSGAFADTLDMESVLEIDRLGKELNSPRMDLWIARQAQTVKKMVPQVAPAAESMSSLQNV